MDSKAQLTVDIIAKVAENRITIGNAAKLLNKSRRTIERYVKQYQQVGIQFAIHGNRGKAPPNKTPVSIKKAVQTLIKEKYFDLNLLHLMYFLTSLPLPIPLEPPSLPLNFSTYFCKLSL